MAKKFTVLISWAHYMTFEAANDDDAIKQANEWAAEISEAETASVFRQANMDVEIIENDD